MSANVCLQKLNRKQKDQFFNQMVKKLKVKLASGFFPQYSSAKNAIKKRIPLGILLNI